MSFRLVSAQRSDTLTTLMPALLQPVDCADDVVAIQSPNAPAYVVALLRYWHQGKTILPLDPKIPPAEVDAILAQEGISQRLSAEDLEQGLEHCLKQRKIEWDEDAETVLGDMKSTSDAWEPADWVPMEQAVSLIRTSGSSSYPKLAQHTWANHVLSANGSQMNLPLTPQDSWLLSLPLFHVGGLAIVVRCWLAGATVQVPDPEQSLADALLQFRPSHLSLVPTQLQRLLSDDVTRQALQTCRAILLGGAPVSAALLDRAQAAGLAIHTSYGSTEMSSQITTTPQGFWQQTPVQAACLLSGTVLPHREVCLMQGQVHVRGGTLFQGYRHQGKLNLPLNESGWLNTGDLGEWHGDQLRITGRQDYQFISGGENIQPEEVERHLLAYPEVIEAMVVPVDDSEFGQRPVAFLKLKQPVAYAQVLATIGPFLKARLPKFKVPMAFYPWPEHLQGHKLKPGRKDFQKQGQFFWQDSRECEVIWHDMLR